MGRGSGDRACPAAGAGSAGASGRNGGETPLPRRSGGTGFDGEGEVKGNSSCQAVRKEVQAIKDHPFTPGSLIVHGLVYDLPSGAIEVVVNGYEL